VTHDKPVKTAMTVTELGDVLDVGCVIVDHNLDIKAWNDWLVSASGRAASEVLDQNLIALYPSLKGTPREGALQRVLQGESVVLAHHFHECFIELPPPAGSEDMPRMQQSTRIVPLMEDGTVTGAVVLIEDVTERVTRERDLNAAREKAETASKAKSEFLASISHELRTPLTAILGYADLLESQIAGQLNQGQAEHVGRIISGTWHLIKIIDEILSFSRAEAQKYEVVLERLNVTEILQQAVALLEPLVREKGLGFYVHVPNSPIIIETDALKVRQILLNVIGNAVKFTERGSITVEASEHAGWVNFSVVDTGPGIPPRFHAAVFEAFVQVDQSNTRKKGGTGLGLALSRSLAELLGGRLMLKRSDEQGTEFLLQLPTQPPSTNVSAG
jgi:signal transduction histidine kinase